MKLVPGLVIACLLLNVSCNKSVSYEEAISENQSQFQDTGKREDAKFLVESKSRNMLAVELLKQASTTAYSSAVVSFAKQTLPEQENLNKDLLDLSKEKDISLPDELSVEHQALLSELTSATRQDFDNTFSRIIQRISEENLSSFTSQATQASDPDVRAFAARKLDLIRAHSESLSTMQSQLMNIAE